MTSLMLPITKILKRRGGNIMKNLKLIVLSALLTSCLVLFAQAQSYFQVTGQDEGWSNNDPTWQMVNTDTGVYTFTTTISGAGEHAWKVITQQGSWTDNAPGGSNAWFLLTGSAATVTFYWSNILDTTWSNSSGNLWTNYNAATTATLAYVAVGMDKWLNDTVNGDYDPTWAPAQMTNIGNGIYQLQVTFPTIDPATAGTKAFKVAMMGGWNEQIGADNPLNSGGSWGFNENADSLPLGAFYQNDTILLQADTIHGRLRIIHSNPGIQGAPFYCLGDDQGSVPNGGTQMTSAGGGLYTANVAVTFSSATHYNSVIDSAFDTYPNNTLGAYFQGTTGQIVITTFDTNTYTDGWLPYTNFVYTANTTTWGTHTYGIVGQMLTFFGLGASDWDTALGVAYLSNTTQYGIPASDSIYSWEGVVVSTVSTQQILNWKCIVDDAYTLQINYYGKGYTGGEAGNNTIFAQAGDTILFEADIAKGRETAINKTHAGYLIPSVLPNNGKPSTSGTVSASGGSGTYIAWSSSDTAAVQITGFSGNIANVNYVAYGSSTVTVWDSNGQKGSAIVSTVPTSAPLAPESAFSAVNHNTILWDFKE
jgi:hypothetical protein